MEFTVVYLFASGLSIWSKYFKPGFYKLTKPAPVLMLVVYALFFEKAHFLLIGFLMFSLGGDIFLLGENRKSFVLGLISFLIAHLFLIAVFISEGARIFPLFAAFVLSVSTLYYFFALRKALNAMKIPVIVYLAVISIMTILSAGLRDFSFVVFSGAVLFYVSDAILAYGKFVRKSALSDLFSLSAYYTAELLIVFGLLASVST